MTINQKDSRSAFSNLTLDKLDQMFGLRAWGLVLYGALPASLSLLGIIDVKVAQINQLPAMLVVSLLPLIVTFLLVRARQRDWYFTTDYLNLRTTITTLLIVISATVIAAASGIIRQKYDLWPLDLSSQSQRVALVESFLFGIASLIFSSSLFATILTKGADLPGLPGSGFVTSIAKMRQLLIAIQRSSIWRKYEFDEGIQIFDELKQTRDSIIKELEAALSQPGHRLAKRGLEPLRSELDVFARSITDIRDGKIKDTVEFRWKIRFADLTKANDDAKENLQNERDAIKDQIMILMKLKNLRLGG